MLSSSTISAAPHRWRLTVAEFRHCYRQSRLTLIANSNKTTTSTSTTAKVTTRGTSKGTAKTTTKGSTIRRQNNGTQGQRQDKTLPEGTSSSGGGSDYWSQFYIAITGFPFPLGPVLRRNTVRREVERGTIWTFEQTQALEDFAVFTPVRMTVILLASGGLWVHNPLAPTAELVRLVKELGYPVEHIVLGTFAYEHKQFVGPFSRAFPKAQVFITPYNWSFPINLPPQFFGIFPSGVLVEDLEAPWRDEIDFKLLLPPSIGISDFVRFPEVAFFHKRTRSMMVTDAVIFVDDEPPEVIPVDALLTSARDGFLNTYAAGALSKEEIKAIARPEPAADTPENRRLGWQRMALLVLFFNPYNLLQPQASFSAFSKRLIVAPVVETLVYSKIPNSVRSWIDAICRDWDVQQIIPTHFAGPVKANREDLRRAFAFVYGAPSSADAVYKNALPYAVHQQFTSASAVPIDLASSSSASSSSAEGGPLGALARLFGRPAVPKRAVNFVPEDIKTLNDINNILLKIGAVSALAD